MKQLNWFIVALAGAATWGVAAGQEPGSRESSGVIKTAPEKPPAGRIGTQGNVPVPEPAREPAGASHVPDSCVSSDKETRGAGTELSPALAGRVIGKGRLHFHTAPRMGCQSRNRFIIPGNAVVARRRHGDWLLIEYVSRKGLAHSAWVDAARIDLTESAAKP